MGFICEVDAYYYVLAPLTALMVVLLSAVPGGKYRVGAFLGGMSYPLYLNHWIGIFAAHAVQKIVPIDGKTNVALLSYAIAVGLAAVFYVAVDRVILARRATYFTATTGRRFTALAITLFTIGCVGGWTINRVWPL